MKRKREEILDLEKEVELIKKRAEELGIKSTEAWGVWAGLEDKKWEVYESTRGKFDVKSTEDFRIRVIKSKEAYDAWDWAQKREKKAWSDHYVARSRLDMWRNTY